MAGPGSSANTSCGAQTPNGARVGSPAAAFGEHVARDPTDSVLVRTVQRHLPRLLEAAAADGHVLDARPASSRAGLLPHFVEQALRDLAMCGDFTRGFAHFECERCHAPRIVPFSCKGRTCASCGGRRMSEFAAYAVDRLLPNADYRQWVVTFPWELRRTLAFDEGAARAAFRIAGETISAWLAGADDGGAGRAAPAGLLHIQRFGDGLTLNPHGHFIFSDAVFGPPPPATTSPSGSADAPPAVVSRRVHSPSVDDLQSVVDTIERRVFRALARRCATSDGEDASKAVTDQARLSHLASAAPVAERSPSRPTRSSPASPHAAKRPLAARSAGGFDVHAGVVIPAHARGALERLLRYVARPPVATDRLRELPNGHIAVDLKRAWKNGARTLTFTPLSFMARLAALVPSPGMHLVSYFGVIAPNAALRSAVLPRPPPDGGADPIAPARPKRMLWKDLLRRVFWIDPLACPCGGRFRLVAVVRKPTAVLALCLPAARPARSRAGAPRSTSPATSPRTGSPARAPRPLASAAYEGPTYQGSSPSDRSCTHSDSPCVARASRPTPTAGLPRSQTLAWSNAAAARHLGHGLPDAQPPASRAHPLRTASPSPERSP